MGTPTDTTIVKGLVQANIEDALGSDKTRSAAEASRMRRTVIVPVALFAAEAMASSTSRALLLRTTGLVKVTAARILPDAALTANDTNYATITIVYNDDAGGGDTVVATVTTKTSGSGGSGSWTAAQSVGMTLSTDSSIPASKAVQFVTAKASSGVAVGICKVELELEDI